MRMPASSGCRAQVTWPRSIETADRSAPPSPTSCARILARPRRPCREIRKPMVVSIRGDSQPTGRRRNMDAQIERSKIVVRWIVAGLLFGSVAYLKQRGEVDAAWPQIVLLTALLALLNFAYGGILRRGSAPGWLKYVTTAVDIVLISALTALTGGTRSIFYFAYFIVLISNSFRYGMGMALYVAVIYNL